MLTNEQGEPLSTATIWHAFQRLLAQAGLPRKRVYDSRHPTASFLIDGGHELRDVMEQLGHSQIAHTANVYGHLFSERKRQMAEAMDALHKGRGESKNYSTN